MDKAAIIATVTDYYESWFDGDAARMERTLHPELAKRGRKPDGSIDADTAQTMVNYTKQGMGKAMRPADLDMKIRVDDLYEHIATATVYNALYIEYLHLIRTPDGWKILNAIYVPRK